MYIVFALISKFRQPVYVPVSCILVILNSSPPDPILSTGFNNWYRVKPRFIDSCILNIVLHVSPVNQISNTQ